MLFYLLWKCFLSVILWFISFILPFFLKKKQQFILCQTAALRQNSLELFYEGDARFPGGSAQCWSPPTATALEVVQGHSAINELLDPVDNPQRRSSVCVSVCVCHTESCLRLVAP